MPEPEAGTGPAGGDWPAQAADLIVRVVGQVRDKTTGPAVTVARGVVYGLLAGLLGATAAILVAIGAVRGLDQIVGPTWLVHAIVGAVFVLAGAALWSKRRPAEADRG
jgi:hypothetical protein